MVSFQKEGSWSLSFGGAGFRGLYHVGVSQCLRERAPRLLQGAHRFYGSSSGALSAATLVCGKSVDFCCSQLLATVKVIKGLSLGVFHPAYDPSAFIKKALQAHLPANAHILASKRLGVSLTRWPDCKNVIVTDFATREELIQALLCSSYFPVYSGMIPLEFRGEHYVDGSLSNNLPFEDSSSTITVAPFHGTVDICPQSTSDSLHELYLSNTSYQITTENISLMCSSLFPLSPEMLADLCRQGYLDALRFLERRGLTKEPILWTFVSKEPPVPTEGTESAGCDQRGKAGLAVNWAVPNVLVKDVPDFEQLTPELEAALRKACAEDPSIWAQFWRSGPGQGLMYLLLPFSLPVQFTYFQSRRIVAWLPDMLADLRWMQSQLRSLAHELCTRMKAQLLGAARDGLRPTEGKRFPYLASFLPVLQPPQLMPPEFCERLPATVSVAADPLQPGVAPLVDSTLEPNATQQTSGGYAGPVQ